MWREERTVAAAEAAVDGEIEAVRGRIEHWRRTRKKRTEMPEALWAAAVALTRERDIYPVARALKVDYTSLKLRALQAELDRQTGAAASEAGFVEISTAQIFGAHEPVESVVELSDANGARMTIRMPASRAVDLVGLSDAFWRRSR